MASVSNDGNGRKRIQFIAPDGARRAVRLGKATARQAQAVCTRVEQLVSAAALKHAPDDDTARWLESLDETLYNRLAAVGLARERGSTKLGPFLDAHLKGRTDLKPTTLTALKRVRDDLVAHFGDGRQLATITEGDADDWRLYLTGRDLSLATIRRRSGRAKQLFQAAVRKRLIAVNPFEDIPCAGGQENDEREHFITQGDARAILDACPDVEWRTLFALCRFGGLRCPSETSLLKWSDVNWDKSRFHVHSPKTAHQGKASRWVPLFPELLPYLRASFEAAEPGAAYVLPTLRPLKSARLRHFLHGIIRAAGLTPWEKAFQNLRSTRQTELEETFPSHVVCKWLGNSPRVARKHYLQVTEDHFARGAGVTTATPAGDRQAAQNEAQQALAGGGTGSQVV